MKYFGLVMALVYVGAGIAILLRTGNSTFVQKDMAVFFGIILIAYGAFRGYNALKNYNK